MIKELATLIKLLFASRPIDVIENNLEMPVLTMKHFPFKGYKALQWCGVIIRRQGTIPLTDKDINHERIHVMQAMMCGNSWIKYYLSYLWEWIKQCPWAAPSKASYYVTKYESEAYANEENPNYCQEYDARNLRNKYTIDNAKNKWKQLGGTPAAWKAYVKAL